MPQSKEISSLLEILGEGLANRPDLTQRLQDLSGAGVNSPAPIRKRETMEQRKTRIRATFHAMHYREEMKNKES